MENELLYFFSTIPQVLSAIIALVFVFVFFKLQTIKKEIEIVCNKFATTLGNNITPPRNWQDLGSGTEFMNNYLSKHIKNISIVMYKICEERKNDNKEATENLREITDNVYAIEISKHRLIKNVKMLSAFSFFIILSSLAVIPFINHINSNCIVMYSFFTVFILSTILCLFWVYLILSKSLSNIN